MCDDQELCHKIAVEIRELISDEASDTMLGGMVGSPLECFGFALEWIKKQKNLPYQETWFQVQNCTGWGLHCQVPK